MRSITSGRPPGDPIGRTDMEGVRRFVDNKLIGAVMLVKHDVRTLKRRRLHDLTGINKEP